MLKTLSIDNFAIISQLQIDWSESLNIVTGQTGAGKSIILGALSLLAGRKADASLLLDPNRNLVIEGTFDVRGYGLKDFFMANDLELSDEIIVRRQVSSQGKSRCFIDDVPVSQSILKELMDHLIDIHSQNQSLLLSQEEFQLKMVDAVALTQSLKEEVSDLYAKYENLKRKESQLRDKVVKTEKESDFLSFQIDEIENLKLQSNEIEDLEQRLSVLQHSEQIAHCLSGVYELIENDENGIYNSLYSVFHSVSSSVRYMSKLKEIAERLESSSIELRDIASEAESMLSSLNVDENEKDFVQRRLDEINSVLAKHNVTSEQELFDLLRDMKERLSSLDSDRELLAETHKNVEKIYGELKQKCSELSSKRKKAAPQIETYVVKTISALAMEKSRFLILFTDKEPSSDGSDRIEFLFSANPLSKMQSISKNASGGEISRLMLAIKSLAAQSMKLPTIIFDEIDTGVSGSVADSMGNMIVSMAKKMQVINITHLPQVAAKGDNHYEVYKKDSRTYIKRLSREERVEKIAEMLSGADVTEAARKQAVLLLKK